jgi:pseudaminic acid synthase
MIFKKPFLIAEISANHAGSFQKAKKLIMCAKKNGANAVKLQTYTPDSMTLRSSKKYFKIKSGLWKGYNLWDLYKKAQTPLIWHKKLFNYAKKIGITIFSTPFDESAVDFLEELKCPFYKVSSFEMTDLPLIKKIAKTKKLMIISTGMANLDEIAMTVKCAKKNGSKKIVLLYCVSNYPSKNSDFNINNINILKKKFKCEVGLSDHSKDNLISSLAISQGVKVIEKHIALENQKKGLDLEFSLKGRQIKAFKKNMIETFDLLKNKNFLRNKSEDKNKIFRRSIFAVEDIKAGSKFLTTNIRRIRPGYGVEPRYYEKLINKKSPKDFLKGEPITKLTLKKIKII